MSLHSANGDAARLAAAALMGAATGGLLVSYFHVGRQVEQAVLTKSKKLTPSISKSNSKPLSRDRSIPDVRREVVCADAIEWLQKQGALPPRSLVYTSLPDSTEVREVIPTYEGWKVWFEEAARSVLLALPPGGIAVFYQTDVRQADRGHTSKSYMVLKAGEDTPGIDLLWHKIVHFGCIDECAYNKVQYTHLLCFWKPPSEGADLPDLGTTIPDIVSRGEKPWGLKNSARCMGAGATLAVVKWAAKRLPQVDTIVDPFCGAGTALAIANELGLHALGVDNSSKRCKQAKALDGSLLLAGKDASHDGKMQRPPLKSNRGSELGERDFDD
eukprot:TRINITY_DN21982_c0_g1_i1.p1 TRINITY_DN21982_c0_g1~~TRINITY_DN21982_c0_g1_i1.p1  ORF type:complete len:329 (-),score=62.78 TRINITY_DN21982_c0_g1_i1:64-1050(-)